MTPVLVARGLRKTYGGIEALKGVDFELKAGEVHALCGENGAGKSTLVRMIAGLAAPDSGEIVIDGTPLRPGHRTDPRLVSVVYQELSIIPHLSVIDNVLMGDPSVGQVYRRGAYAAEVRRRLDETGLSGVALNAPAGQLTVAERQLLEICRASMRGARILILDEPTASLSDAEIHRVFAIVRGLRERGTAVVFISHRLPEVFALTDRVTVFRDGRRVLTRPTAELDNDQLVREMIGRDVASTRSHGHSAVSAEAPVAVSFRNVALAGRLRPTDLDIRRGEVVGIVGQLGSGANAIVGILAGVEKFHTGKVAVEGRPVQLASIADSMRAGIAYVSEDRSAKSLFLGAPVEVNLTAAVLDRLNRHGLLRLGAARALATRLANQFQIDPRRLPAAASDLSGGNQQKVAIAKSVALAPKVLVLNEPTRGVDVGARTEIYRELQALAAAGLAIVFFSPDIEEIRDLSQRVITVFRGGIVSDRKAEDTTLDGILGEVLRGPAEEAAAA